MTRRISGFLLGVAAFSVYEWAVLIRNIAKDHEPGHGTAFHVVHYVLAAINLTIAVVMARIGWRGWRAAAATADAPAADAPVAVAASMTSTAADEPGVAAGSPDRVAEPVADTAS